ncbi:MAG: hypothetical protein Q7U28_06060 [Aquabacterium sp.]|nr:hypothetical protein [Aquabacterium sp.]
MNTTIKQILAYTTVGLFGAMLLWPILGKVWQKGSATPDAVFIFKDLKGPSEPSVIKAAVPTLWQADETGGDARMAILLTDTDSAWMGLAQGLRSVGIPFVITRDYQQAMRHRVVVAYPTISGKALTADALRALSRHPAQGGTLIGFNVEGGGLQEVFGFSQVSPSTKRHSITFDTTQALASIFVHERERTVPFAARPTEDLQRTGTSMGSLAYLDAPHPLARFDDGTAAVTFRQIGQGKALAFGVDIGALMQTGYSNREQGIARSYVNEYEPALDVWLRLLKQIYMQGEPLAVTIGTVPQGKPLAVLLSHDIDYTKSLVNATAYAQFEASQGVLATYFIQTKYIRDWNDNIFFNSDGIASLRALHKLNAEIASHSVAHSQVFNHAELGDGRESYPLYQPFVHDAKRTDGMTVMGELRISKFLLDHFLPDTSVDSFRPGHLKNPYSLPQALEATGYQYSSSVTANNSLSHLPFGLTYGREGQARTAIYEFPVTIEDEALPRLGDRVPQALALAQNLSRYGGLLVVLIHTDVLDHKLAFERALVAALHDKAWFGTMRSFGQFWAARDQLRLDVSRHEATVQITIKAPEPIHGLTLQLPPACRVSLITPSTVAWQQRSTALMMERVAGQADVTLQGCQ